jgi:hypothetical protein
MKWICPRCPELNHGTRHESVLRHIRRKHDGIGEPLNLNSGFTRSQMGLTSDRRPPYIGELLTMPQFFAPANISKSGIPDFCDWTENKILRPMRQKVELTNLINQFKTSSLVGNLPNVSQGITGSYSSVEMQISVDDLFGCKVLVCENCCSLEIRSFYFHDPREVKPASTIIEHTCPEYSYTMLKWISDENKKLVRDHTKRLNRVDILMRCALNHWNESGILYFLGIKIPNSIIQCVKVADPNIQDKSFIIQYSQEDTIELDNMSKNHWINRILRSEGETNEVSLYDLDLDDFLVAAKFATFCFFRIKSSGEYYFIMLTDNAHLTLTLVDCSKQTLY